MKSLLLITAFWCVAEAKGFFDARWECRSDSCYSAVTAAGYPDHPSSDCKSFMATTVASTVVTATSTSTITKFNNNKFNPPIPTHSNAKLTQDKSGLYTITPTVFPNYIMPGCGTGTNGEEEKQQMLKDYRSVCACEWPGALPTIQPTKSIQATATITVVEYFPTTVSDFLLLVVFPNETSRYVSENTTAKGGWFDLTHLKLVHPVPEDYDLKTPNATAEAALFGLTPAGFLRLESQGKFSGLENMRVDNTSGCDPYCLQPAPLVFSNTNQSTGRYEPLMGCHIANIPKPYRTILNAIHFSPQPESVESPFFQQPPKGFAKLSLNMTVLVTCEEGLCLGTPDWQREMFDKDMLGGYYSRSKDGRYELVNLRAVPVY